MGLKITCDDVNLTHNGQPVVLFEVPLGFDFITSSMPVEHVSGRLYRWRPDMRKVTYLDVRPGASLTPNQLVATFMPNLTFSSGQSLKDFTFTMMVEGTGVSSTVSGTVYKELPKTDTEEGEGEQSKDGTKKGSPEEILTVQKDETFTILMMPHPGAVIFPEFSVPEGLDITIAYDEDFTQLISKNRTADGRDVYRLLDGPTFADELIYLKIHDVGRIELYTQTMSGLGPSPSPQIYATLDVRVIPLESELTTPNFTRLSLGEEELDRLGDGYLYTLADRKSVV